MKGPVSVLLLSALLAGCGVSGEEIQTKEKNEPSRAKTTASSEGRVIKENRVSIEPSRIEIPSLDVDAKIEEAGLLANGQMEDPKSPETVGWYANGTKPGERGNAVLAGHVDSKTGPAVFFDLQKLNKGDEIIVSDEEGERLTFVVEEKKKYRAELSPIEDIFDYSYQSHLNLITCTGVFDQETKNYDERLVVYTTLQK
ncbi:class F sortase [Exiguobacterium flavidum]|uniref:class F sortase n=1 Tax=Exiguobacterium flavidum TaxID=2184695 RepID=UPI000DF7AC85|nr:class F sortase [Exiguobacterium flavidum]